MAFYNVAGDLIGRNLPHRAAKVALIDDRGTCTYAELSDRVDRQRCRPKPSRSPAPANHCSQAVLTQPPPTFAITSPAVDPPARSP